MASFQTAERLSGHLAAPLGSYFATPTRAFLLYALVRLAQDDARGGRRAGACPGRLRSPGLAKLLVNAFLLEAIVRDALGDPAAAGRALERALDAAEPDLILFPFLIHPRARVTGAPRPEMRQTPALISEILSLLPAEHEERGRPAAELLDEDWMGRTNRARLEPWPPRCLLEHRTSAK